MLNVRHRGDVLAGALHNARNRLPGWMTRRVFRSSADRPSLVVSDPASNDSSALAMSASEVHADPAPSITTEPMSDSHQLTVSQRLTTELPESQLTEACTDNAAATGPALINVQNDMIDAESQVLQSLACADRGMEQQQQQQLHEETNALPRFRLLASVPRYTSRKAIEEFAARIPDLKAIHIKRRYEGEDFDLYWEVEDPEMSLPKLNVTDQYDVIINDRKLSVRVISNEYGISLLKSDTVTMPASMSSGADAGPGEKKFTIPADVEFPVKCQYCHDDVASARVTMCLSCTRVTCVECCRRQFQTALRYREQMPVRCCGVTVHPDTVGGILTAEEIKVYKTRFEEMCTRRPFYCASNSCSVFIPPRKLRIVEGQVTCFACKSKSCHKCRQLAETDHQCGEYLTIEDEMLEKFDYKRCPHCKTGQARMFGCNHMRCTCGTHWCWDCSKIMDHCQCRDEYDDEAYEPNEYAEEPEEADGRLWEFSDDDDNPSTPNSSVIGDVQEATSVMTKGESVYSNQDDGLEQNLDIQTEQVHDDESGEKLNIETMSDVAQESNEAGDIEMVSEQIHQIDETDRLDETRQQFENADDTIASNDNSHDGNEDVLMTSDDDGNHIANDGNEDTQVETQANEERNFDSFSVDDWEGSQFNFGSEPGDYHHEPWNCHHEFIQIIRDNVPRYWMRSETEIKGDGHDENDNDNDDNNDSWWKRDEHGNWHKTVSCMICQVDANIKDTTSSKTLHNKTNDEDVQDTNDNDSESESESNNDSDINSNEEKIEPSHKITAIESNRNNLHSPKYQASHCYSCGIICCGICQNILTARGKSKL